MKFAFDQEIQTRVHAVARWFQLSRIQSSDGGVARYYRSDLGANAPVSTEITGYAVSALSYLHRLTDDDGANRGAADAVRFLTDVAWDPQLSSMPFECGPTPQSAGGLSYFFDCGIIARGLLAWWRLTGDERALEIAAACGQSMARDFRLDGRPFGEFAPVITLPGKNALPLEPNWSRSPGCYQLKSAMAWLELADVYPDEPYEDWYEQAVDAALRSHEAFLPDPCGGDRTMDRLHAYSYFLEALLPRAGDSSVRRVLAAGIARVRDHLWRMENRFVRSDVYAQLLRVRLLANALEAVPLDAAQAEHEATALLAFQYERPDDKHDGGFWFGRQNGRFLPYLNPVSTAFAMQALEMWRRHQEGGTPGSVRDLI